MVPAQKQIEGKWNRIEDPDIISQSFIHLVLDKNILWRKDSLFNKWYCETGHLHAKKTETRTLFLILHKNHLQLDQRPETLKLPQKNMGK
jgi:hypothetical protein